jgi:hypothetical protein
MRKFVTYEGRRFIVSTSRTGILQVHERKTVHPDHPYLNSVGDYCVYHAGCGRKPSRMVRAVLYLAGVELENLK